MPSTPVRENVEPLDAEVEFRPSSRQREQPDLAAEESRMPPAGIIRETIPRAFAANHRGRRQ